MGMFASTEFYEASLNILVNGTKRILICPSCSQPANSTDATASMLAKSTTVASTDIVVSGGTSGYSVQISSNADLISASTLETTGVAEYVVLCSTVADDEMLYITTCTTKTLASGDTVTMPTWSITIEEPTS